MVVDEQISGVYLRNRAATKVNWLRSHSDHTMTGVPVTVSLYRHPVKVSSVLMLLTRWNVRCVNPHPICPQLTAP